MKLPNASLGLKLNVALLTFILLLGLASSAIILYGFSRTQDNATERSREALEEQGKLALQALAGGVTDAGVIQFESAAAIGQRASRYLQDYKQLNGTPEYDTSGFVRLENGVAYNPDPTRVSDVAVVNHGELEGAVLDDIAYTAALDSLFPALIEPFPGEIANDAYRPIAMTFVGVNGVGRIYPPIGVQETTQAEVDVSALRDAYGPLANPGRETVWSAPYDDAQGRGLVMTALTPVYDGDSFRGIFEVDLSIVRLVELIDALKPTESGFTFYVDTEGKILETSSFELLSREAERNAPITSILDEMSTPVDRRDIVVEKVPLEGEEYFIAYTPMLIPGGSLAVAAPVDEVTDQAAQITAGIEDEGNRTFGIMLAAMAALFVAGLLGATYLNRSLLLVPLSRLFEGTRAVAAGDLDTRVELDRGDELGALADSFNAMVEQLRESERALEKRVEERTQELGLLLELSRAISSTLDLRPLLDLLLDEVQKVVPYDGAGITLHIGDELRQVAVRRPPEYAEEAANVAHVTKRETWRESEGRLDLGKALIIRDVTDDSPAAAAFRESWGGDLSTTTAAWVRSMIVVPLASRDRTIGNISIGSKHLNFFTDEQVRVVQAVAGQAASAIENARMYEETQQSARETEALLEVSGALASTLELRPLLEVILDELRNFVDYAGASVNLLRGGMLYQLAVRRPRGPEVTAEDIGIGWPASTFSEGAIQLDRAEPLIITDIHGDSDEAVQYRAMYGGSIEGTRVEYIRSFMGVPLVARNKLVGVLSMGHDEPGFLRQEHARLLQPLADQAAVAIENARLYEETQRRARETEALLNTASAVVSTLDLHELMAVILEQTSAIIERTGTAILTLEGDDLLFWDALSGPGAGPLKGARIPLAASRQLWRPISRGEAVIIHDVKSDHPMAAAYREAVGSTGLLDAPPLQALRSWMGVPLAAKGEVFGMLTLSNIEPGYFTEDHARLAGAFADLAALAIEHARLFDSGQQVAALEERQRLARELHDSVSQALYGIALGARTARTLLDRDPAKAIEPTDYILSLAEAGLAEMRSLIFELRPESLEAEGLVAALEKQVAATRARYGIAIDATLGDEPEIPLETKEALYRIGQEALHNIVKHARASGVNVSLGSVDGELRLSIRDDGVGFDPEGDFAGHLGLKSMRERIAARGGTIIIESKPDAGTTVRVSVPIAI